MQKISLFILFCCLSIAGYATQKYAVSSASAPSGLSTYCYGAISSSSYTCTWAGCGTGSGTVELVNYAWLLNGNSIATGSFSVTPANVSTGGTITLAANALNSMSVGTNTLTVKFSWSSGVDPSGCSGGFPIYSANKLITVNSQPTVAVTPSTYTYCFGSPGVAISATSSTGTNFSWQPNDGTLSSTTTANVIATLLASEVYTVTVTDANSCTNSASANITVLPFYVNPTPIPSIICSGGAATLTATSQTGDYTSDAVVSIPYTVIPTNGVPVLNSDPGDYLGADLDDQTSNPATIPFTFYFYGIGYTSVNISSAGYISFGETYSANDGYSAAVELPDGSAPDDGVPVNLVALFMHWMDPDIPSLIGGPSPTITYTTIGTSPNQEFVVTYSNVEDADESGNVNTGQIILYEGSNNIDLLIGACSCYNSTTVGIQNGDGTNGVTPALENDATFTIPPGGEGWRFIGTTPPDASVSYLWSPGGSTSNSITVTPTTTSSYTVTGTLSGCSQTQSAVTIVTVIPQPTVTPTSASICPTGSVTLTTTVSSGTVLPTYAWSGPGITSSTTSSSPFVITPTVTGNYSVIVSYPAPIGCANSAVTSSVTVVGSPTVTSVTASASSICSTGSLTLAATESGGVGNATYTWSGPGIATTTTTGPSLGISPSVTGTGDYTVTVYYDGSGCGSSAPTASSSVTVTGYTSQVWIGGAAGEPNDWNTAANWGCGTVPVITDNVEIPSVTATNAPTLAVTGTGIGYANNLVIDYGASLTILSNDVLNVAGNFSVNATANVTMNSGAVINAGANLYNNSSISGAGTLSLTASAPSITGNGAVSNMTLNNSTGATIGSSGSSVAVTGVLLLNAGTLTTNNNLLLSSYAAGASTTTPTISGSIGPIPSTNTTPISGLVTVQQHFAGYSRAWRFIAHPFNTSVHLLDQIEPYIDITGEGGITNGFTTTGTNNPSSMWYNTVEGNSSDGDDPGWTAFTNITNLVYQYQGINLFVRGAKGLGLNGEPYTPDSVSYMVYGEVNTGTQTVTMTMGASSAYNLLGNPFPSVVDIGTILDNAYTAGTVQGSAYYVWNPYLSPSTSGAFVTIDFGSGPYYLGANESFEVQTAANGNTLVFPESSKTSNAPSAALMRSSADNVVSLYLYSESYHLMDMLKVKFNDAASDSDDARYDAGKPPSPSDLEFYTWSASHTRMAIDARPYAAGKVIPIGLMTKIAMPMIIKVNQLDVPIGGQVYLHDKLMQQYILLEQGTEYRFMMDSSATQADNRFELRMGPASATELQNNYSLNVQMAPNPATSEVTIVYTAKEKAQTAISIANVMGETVQTQDLGIQQSGSTVIPVSKLPAGVYMVTLTSGDSKVVKRLVKE